MLAAVAPAVLDLLPCAPPPATGHAWAAKQPYGTRSWRRRLGTLVCATPPPSDEDAFEVTVARPLGIQLQEEADVGVVVSAVLEGSNAFKMGIAVGDVVLATSATMGYAPRFKIINLRLRPAMR